MNIPDSTIRTLKDKIAFLVNLINVLLTSDRLGACPILYILSY